MAYTFYLDGIKLPVTPEALEIKIKNTNKIVTLINDGEINILKTPGLSDVSFEFLIPTRSRSFTNDLKTVEYYLDLLERLKVNGKPFQFIVYRETLGGKPLFKTNMTVSLEEYGIVENADNLTDILVNVILKQYRKYGTKVLEVKYTTTKEPVATPKPPANTSSGRDVRTYTVKSGDTLWGISQRFLGNGAKWKTIYDMNKSVIEATARSRGFKSSSNGHWIFPSTKLVIP